MYFIDFSFEDNNADDDDDDGDDGEEERNEDVESSAKRRDPEAGLPSLLPIAVDCLRAPKKFPAPCFEVAGIASVIVVVAVIAVGLPADEEDDDFPC